MVSTLFQAIKENRSKKKQKKKHSHNGQCACRQPSLFCPANLAVAIGLQLSGSSQGKKNVVIIGDSVPIYHLFIYVIYYPWFIDRNTSVAKR